MRRVSDLRRLPIHLFIEGYPVVSLKDPGAPKLGCLINTAYRTGSKVIEQTVEFSGKSYTFRWTSVERAYRAQALIHTIERLHASDAKVPLLIQVLKDLEKFEPSKEFVPASWGRLLDLFLGSGPGKLAQDKDAFDVLCDAQYHPVHNPSQGLDDNGKPWTTHFMVEAMYLGLEADPDAAATLRLMMREGIIFVERSQHDDNWGFGSSGTGHGRFTEALFLAGFKYMREHELIRDGEALPLYPRAMLISLKRNSELLRHDALDAAAKREPQYYSLLELPSSPNGAEALLRSAAASVDSLLGVKPALTQDERRAAAAQRLLLKLETPGYLSNYPLLKGVTVWLYKDSVGVGSQPALKLVLGSPAEKLYIMYHKLIGFKGDGRRHVEVEYPRAGVGGGNQLILSFMGDEAQLEQVITELSKTTSASMPGWAQVPARIALASADAGSSGSGSGAAAAGGSGNGGGGDVRADGTITAALAGLSVTGSHLAAVPAPPAAPADHPAAPAATGGPKR